MPLSPYAPGRRSTDRRRSGGKKRPARSYRNSSRDRQSSNGDRRGYGRDSYGQHTEKRQGQRRDGPRHYGAGNFDKKYGKNSESEKNPEFYDMMRNRLYEMLGGMTCSGCGFRDKRALGIALKYAHATGSTYDDDDAPLHFDSVCRGGVIASRWPKYESDPDLAASELIVLCLNCNRIREPVLKTAEAVRGDNYIPGPKRRPKTFPR